MNTRAGEAAKHLAERFGVYAESKALLKAVNRTRAWLAYRRASSPWPVTLAGTTTQFPTPTQRIYQWVSGMPERDLIAWFCYELESDDVVWDVGAHIGMFAFPATQRVPEGRVVAFEPGPNNLDYLRWTRTLNETDNLTIEPCALGTSDGTTSLELRENSSTHRTVADGMGDVTVRTARSDDLVADGEAPQPTVVKIDVEGGELDVLDGMASVLDGCRLVLCEVHRAQDVTDDAVRARLTDHGFDCRMVKETIRGSKTTANIVARC